MISVRRKIIFTGVAVLAAALTACSEPGGDRETTRGRGFVLEGRVEDQVKETLASLAAPVTIRFYRDRKEDQANSSMAKLLDMVTAASPHIALETITLDGLSEAERPPEAGHGPVVLLEGQATKQISYYGYPDRLELASFLDSILIASGEHRRLSAKTLDFLDKLDRDVTFKVFASPD